MTLIFMYDVYMWNKNTDNKIFIVTFNTEKEAKEFIIKNTTNEFIYYIKERK